MSVASIQGQRRGARGKEGCLSVSGAEKGYFERNILVHAQPVSPQCPADALSPLLQPAQCPGRLVCLDPIDSGEQQVSQEASPHLLSPGSENHSLPSTLQTRRHWHPALAGPGLLSWPFQLSVPCPYFGVDFFLHISVCTQWLLLADREGLGALV